LLASTGKVREKAGNFMLSGKWSPWVVSDVIKQVVEDTGVLIHSLVLILSISSLLALLAEQCSLPDFSNLLFIKHSAVMIIYTATETETSWYILKFG